MRGFPGEETASPRALSARWLRPRRPGDAPGRMVPTAVAPDRAGPGASADAARFQEPRDSGPTDPAVAIAPSPAEGVVPSRAPFGRPAPGRVRLAGRAFQPGHYRALHALVSRHVQLLIQQYGMAVSSGAAARARVLRAMLDGLQAHVGAVTAERRAMGAPRYDPGALSLEADGEADGEADAALCSPGSRRWAPKLPVPAYTIADVAPLRHWRAVAEALPLADANRPPPSSPGGARAWDRDDLCSSGEDDDDDDDVGGEAAGGARAFAGQGALSGRTAALQAG